MKSFVHLSCLILIIVMMPAALSAQTFNDDLYVVDGAVHATLIDGNNLFIGGEFSYVGPNTGSGAVVTQTATTPDADFPVVNGIIYDAVEDLQGGWFIAGDFDNVGGVAIDNLAFIDANGNVDPNWNPNPNGAVYTIETDYDNIYIGGTFTQVNGTQRYKIASLDYDKQNVTLNGFNPGPNGDVHAILLASHTLLYIGGNFTTVGSYTRNYAAAVYIGSSVPSGWNPNCNGRVRALAGDANNSNIFLGGDFTKLGNKTRKRVAKVGSDGSVKSWSKNLNGSVYDIVFHEDNIYVGGDFTTAGSSNRKRLAKISSGSGGILRNWNPKANELVTDLAMDTDNDALYVGGLFTELGGQPRNYVGRVGITNATSGAQAWDPNADDWVWTVDLEEYTTGVFIGGRFGSIDGVERSNIARLNLTTGVVDATWTPEVTHDDLHDGAVFALDMFESGLTSTLIVGGHFTDVDNEERYNLAAIDADDGTIANWTPNPTDNNGTLANDATVYALHVSASTLYVGGVFALLGEQAPREARQNIGAVSLTTGDATAWNPGANNTVLAVRRAGSNVYAGGLFTTAGGLNRNSVAQIDAGTGNANAVWDANIATGVPVYAIEQSSTGSIFIGGDFNNAGGQARLKVAELESFDGDATSWMAGNVSTAPGVGGLGVRALFRDGDRIYIGGSFSSVGGLATAARDNIAVVSASSGNVYGWDVGTEGTVNDIDVSTSDVCFGGWITEANGIARKGLGCASVSFSKRSAFGAAKTTGAHNSGLLLQPVSPNPVSAAASLEFSVINGGHAQLLLSDALGRTVAELFNGTANPGQTYRLDFDARVYSAGSYVLVLQSGGQTVSRQMVIAD